MACFEYIQERTAFDFESTFTTVAMVEGCSERVHVDANDQGITWVLPLGNWEGANFMIPQLDLEILVKSGQLLGFSANLLAHYCTPITSGHRVVITMFTCCNLFHDTQHFFTL